MERATEIIVRKEAEEIVEASLDLIERMLRILDRLDHDPDLEDGGDAEPSLGWPMGHGIAQLRTDISHDDDPEHDDADHEDNGDAEPEDGI